MNAILSPGVPMYRELNSSAEAALMFECHHHTAKGDRRTEQGDFPVALASIARAVAVAEKLVADFGHQREHRDRHVRLLEKLGDLHSLCGNSSEAETAYRAMEQVSSEKPPERAEGAPSDATPAPAAIEAPKPSPPAKGAKAEATRAENGQAVVPPKTTISRPQPVESSPAATNNPAAPVEAKAAPSAEDVMKAYKLLFDAGQSAYDRQSWALALRAFEDALRKAEEAQAHPSQKALWRARISAALCRIGDIHFSCGRFAEAKAAYERDLALSQEALQTDKENPRLLRAYSISLGCVGEALLALGDLVSARRHFDQSQTIRLQLCSTADSNSQYLRDLMISRTRQANLAVATQDSGQAKSEIEQALNLAERLCQLDPQNPALRKDRVTIKEFLVRLGQN